MTDTCILPNQIQLKHRTFPVQMLIVLYSYLAFVFYFFFSRLNTDFPGSSKLQKWHKLFILLCMYEDPKKYPHLTLKINYVLFIYTHVQKLNVIVHIYPVEGTTWVNCWWFQTVGITSASWQLQLMCVPKKLKITEGHVGHAIWWLPKIYETHN